MNFKEFKQQFQDELYEEYRVKLRLHDIAGGTPMSPDLIKGWIDATCKDKSDEERAKLVEASLEALPDISEEKAARSWVGFKRNENGEFFIDGRCIKAMLKEGGNILKEIIPNGGKQRGKNKGKDKGITALKSKVADRVFVVEHQVYFTRNGERVKEAQLEERPVHAMTPQGPRSSLKRTDILRDVDVEFTVRRLATDDVPEEALYAILVYAQQLGLGADRSQGRGTMEDIDVEKTKEVKR